MLFPPWWNPICCAVDDHVTELCDSFTWNAISAFMLHSWWSYLKLSLTSIIFAFFVNVVHTVIIITFTNWFTRWTDIYCLYKWHYFIYLTTFFMTLFFLFRHLLVYLSYFLIYCSYILVYCSYLLVCCSCLLVYCSYLLVYCSYFLVSWWNFLFLL